MRGCNGVVHMIGRVVVVMVGYSYPAVDDANFQRRKGCNGVSSVRAVRASVVPESSYRTNMYSTHSQLLVKRRKHGFVTT